MPSLFLSGIRRIPPSPDREEFPWSVPLFRDLAALEFQSPVTFLVGENGSGKSTLLEALAVGMHAVAVGRAGLDRDETLAGARALAGAFRFVRRRHPAARLFLRAEDVFGCTRRIAGEIVELRATEDDLTRDLPAASAARAAGAVARERLALERRYGAEPEAPLSPVRVLALIALLKDRVAQDCQFIIATHSPILMACPDAEILVLDDARIRRVPYDDLEHVRLTREVLNDPDVFLRRL